MAYQQVVLAKRPGAGPIVPGETFRMERKTRVTGAELTDGQFEAKTLYLSLDPAMRGWLNGLFSFSSPHHHTPAAPGPNMPRTRAKAMDMGI